MSSTRREGLEADVQLPRGPKGRSEIAACSDALDDLIDGWDPEAEPEDRVDLPGEMPDENVLKELEEE